LQGVISKKIIIWDKAKLGYFAEGKDLLTHYFSCVRISCKSPRFFIDTPPLIFRSASQLNKVIQTTKKDNQNENKKRTQKNKKHPLGLRSSTTRGIKAGSLRK
jgi:hypothetical protein